MKAVSKPRTTQYANAWEAAYAAILTLRVRAGDIAEFWYSPVKIILADRTTFTPDFLVQDKWGNLEFHEVKGFMREDALVKLRVAAALVPWATFKLVTNVKPKTMAYDIKEI